MKVFATGLTGFLGTEFRKELQSKNISYLAVTRQKKLANKLENFFEGSLTEVESWIKRVEEFQPEAAVLFAWDSLPDYGFENNLQNFISNIKLIEHLGRAGCKKIIIAGTCWEYREQSGELVEEKSDIISFNQFGGFKKSVYNLAQVIGDKYGMKIIEGRVFYSYGPNQREKSLIPYIIKSILSGNQLKIRTPEMANDFIFVSDVASAFSTLLENGSETGIYNISFGRSTQVREIVNLICKELSQPPLYDIEYKKFLGFWGRNSKLCKLGWRPKISIEEGLRLTILSLR